MKKYLNILSTLLEIMFFDSSTALERINRSSFPSKLLSMRCYKDNIFPRGALYRVFSFLQPLLSPESNLKNSVVCLVWSKFVRGRFNTPLVVFGLGITSNSIFCFAVNELKIFSLEFLTFFKQFTHSHFYKKRKEINVHQDSTLHSNGSFPMRMSVIIYSSSINHQVLPLAIHVLA